MQMKTLVQEQQQQEQIQIKYVIYMICQGINMNGQVKLPDAGAVSLDILALSVQGLTTLRISDPTVTRVIAAAARPITALASILSASHFM